MFVLLIGTRPGQLDRPKRETNSHRLRFYQSTPDRVHRDAIRFGIKGSDNGGYLNVRVLPEKM